MYDSNVDGTIFLIDIDINRHIFRITPSQKYAIRTPIFGSKFGENPIEETHAWKIEKLKDGGWNLFYSVLFPTHSR